MLVEFTKTSRMLSQTSNTLSHILQIVEPHSVIRLRLLEHFGVVLCLAILRLPAPHPRVPSTQHPEGGTFCTQLN